MEFIGKKFNRLTVLERVENNKHGQTVVKVQCDCCDKTILNVSLYKLKDGHTKSCGCLLREVNSLIHRKYNIFDLTNAYGIGYTSEGEEFYFDLEDYDKIKDYYWFINSDGYVKTRVKSVPILMHRLFLNITTNLVADHINHIRHDNRKSNIREVTQLKNCLNQLSRNKFGIKGVSWNKKDKVWDMRIKTVDGLIRKRFKNIVESIDYRVELEKKYWKENRYVWENNINMEELLEWEKELKQLK